MRTKDSSLAMKKRTVFPTRFKLPKVGSSQMSTTVQQKQQQFYDKFVHRDKRNYVCRFWKEKAYLIIDTFQVYGLIWQLSQPWPWPARWLHITKWVNIFNLDFFTFTEKGAAMGATSQSFSLWGEMEHYWVYAFLMSILPALGLFIYRFHSFYRERVGRPDVLLKNAELENKLLQCGQILYLPIGLAVLRLWNCNDDKTLSVDPTLECWGVFHLVVFTICTCILGGFFLLFFPFLLVKRIKTVLVYENDPELHERFLLSKELEYMLNTSNDYIMYYLPQYASYQSEAVFMPFHTLFLKCSLLVVFSILRTPPKNIRVNEQKTNAGLQGTLFFTLILLFSFYRTWKAPYRITSSNRLAKLLDWALTANCVVVLFCANGVRSALTVTTSVMSILCFINLSFSALALVFIIHLFNELKQPFVHEKICLWPGISALHSAIEDKVCGFEVLAEWIYTIHTAEATLTKALMAPEIVKPYQELFEILIHLKKCNAVAETNKHLLEGQLNELSMYVQEIYVEALATSPFKSELAQPKEDFARLNNLMMKRHDMHTMLPPKSKRLLSKLSVIRTWNSSPHEAFDNSLTEFHIESFFAKSTLIYKMSAQQIEDWMPVMVSLSISAIHQHNNRSFHIKVTFFNRDKKLFRCYLNEKMNDAIVNILELQVYFRWEIENYENSEAVQLFLHALGSFNIISPFEPISPK